MIESAEQLFLLAGAALFAVGLSGVFRQAESLRRIISINVMSSGVFLIFIAVAASGVDGKPDPVPQAMVLTGIVVAVCATGLALILADLDRRHEDEAQEEDPT